MKEIFIFNDWEVITSGVEVQMFTEGTRDTEEGVERIKARIRFFNDDRTPELRMKRYNAKGEIVEAITFSTEGRPYDVFATFERQVMRMRRGEVLEIVDQEK